MATPDRGRWSCRQVMLKLCRYRSAKAIVRGAPDCVPHPCLLSNWDGSTRLHERPFSHTYCTAGRNSRHEIAPEISEPPPADVHRSSGIDGLPSSQLSGLVLQLIVSIRSSSRSTQRLALACRLIGRSFGDAVQKGNATISEWLSAILRLTARLRTDVDRDRAAAR